MDANTPGARAAIGFLECDEGMPGVQLGFIRVETTQEFTVNFRRGRRRVVEGMGNGGHEGKGLDDPQSVARRNSISP